MMRRWLWAFSLASVLGIAGCGKPDPRSRPDFIDTSDPRKAAELLKGSTTPTSVPGKTAPRPGGS